MRCSPPAVTPPKTQAAKHIEKVLAQARYRRNPPSAKPTIPVRPLDVDPAFRQQGIRERGVRAGRGLRSRADGPGRFPLHRSATAATFLSAGRCRGTHGRRRRTASPPIVAEAESQKGVRGHPAAARVRRQLDRGNQAPAQEKGTEVMGQKNTQHPYGFRLGLQQAVEVAGW